MLNPREELVFLLRGFFATPLLTALGKKGILDSFVKGKVDLANFKEDSNIDFLEHSFIYLQSLGLLKRSTESSTIFMSTDLGNKVFKRFGSFVLLYSYRDLVANIDKLLFDKHIDPPKCDRLDNVIGSGLTNGRKFFPSGILALGSNDFSVIVDLACGDGEFLSRMHEVYPRASIVASDISPIAIESTTNNLLSKYPEICLNTVQTDALNVENWMSIVIRQKDKIGDGKIIISMWYLIHEIARHSTNVVADFLTDIYNSCSDAHLLLGEIVNINPEQLASSHHGSIMPEFLFFHELSGQGVLTWDQYQQLLDLIPYKLISEQKFDTVGNDSNQIPSAIVWYLQPK